MNFSCSSGQVFKTNCFIDSWCLRDANISGWFGFQWESVQKSEFTATDKNIVFWGGFNVYRHSVHLFIIYDGVKDIKFAANWIESQLYWHFFIIIKAPGLSLFLFPPIFYPHKWYALSVLEKLSKWWALGNNHSLHKPKIITVFIFLF